MASLAPATTGRPAGRPSSAAGAVRNRPIPLPAAAGDGAIRSSRPAARASAAVIASAGSCRAAVATPVIRNATWSHAARSQADPSTTSGRSAASSRALPSRPTTHPCRPMAAAAAAVSPPARRSSHVIAGARACPSVAVGTSVGPWPTTQSAIGAAGPSATAAANAIPIPRTSAAHQASGSCSARPGEPSSGETGRGRARTPEAPVRGHGANLDGGGSQVDGDEDARIGGHDPGVVGPGSRPCPGRPLRA